MTDTVRATIIYKNEFDRTRYWRVSYNGVNPEAVNRDIGNQALEHKPKGYEIAKIKIEREIEW